MRWVRREIKHFLRSKYTVQIIFKNPPLFNETRQYNIQVFYKIIILK